MSLILLCWREILSYLVAHGFLGAESVVVRFQEIESIFGKGYQNIKTI